MTVKRFSVSPRNSEIHAVFENESIICECKSDHLACAIAVALENYASGASVQRVFELREALELALSYCDHAVHQTQKYQDDRERLSSIMNGSRNVSSMSVEFRRTKAERL